MKLKFVFLVLFTFHLVSVLAQKTLPIVNLKTLMGENFSTSEIKNEGKPMLICFWRTNHKLSVNELNAISKEYPFWQKETGVVMYAISVDDNGSSDKVKPLLETSEWDFQVLLDENSEFLKALSGFYIPEILLFNGNGEIVWRKVGFMKGDEKIIYQMLLKVAKGEEIKE